MILVNAASHPGPALWQGIMLIIVSIWAVALFAGDKPPSKRAMKVSGVIIALIGIVLIVVIVNWPVRKDSPPRKTNLAVCDYRDCMPGITKDSK